jgi:uncharacterized protein YjiS (DUF1127 family)
MSTSSIAFTNFSASRMLTDSCPGVSEPGIAGLATRRIRATVFAWTSRCRRRRAALAIDDRTLADIGLNRGLVILEAAKPFWRL